MRIRLPSGTPSARALVDGAEQGLVVVPDIMGLRPLVDDLIARLSSEWGWSVCAPELYPDRESLDLEGRLEAAAGLSDERVLGDLVEAADATGCRRVGILGFCMGGMYTIKAVATGRFRRHVPFYGMIRLPTAWRGSGQGEPLEALSRSDPRTVLAIIGVEDPYTPPGDVDALEAAGATVVRYAEAEHGFVHDPQRPAHRPDDAADAWRRAHHWLSG
ncbi:MAG: dienelactone hydrolase family protein [Acidimicrobiales bacterium]